MINSKDTAKQFLHNYQSDAKHYIKGIDDPLLHQMFVDYANSLFMGLPDDSMACDECGGKPYNGLGTWHTHWCSKNSINQRLNKI